MTKMAKEEIIKLPDGENIRHFEIFRDMSRHFLLFYDAAFGSSKTEGFASA